MRPDDRDTQPNSIRWSSPEYGDHEGPCLWSKGEDSLIDCASCGFRHVIPLPSAESQRAFYEEAFYQSEKDRYLAEAEEDFEWKAVECGLRYDIAADMLAKKTGNVLDIGCGPGDFLDVGLRKGWSVTGVEPSPIASRYARERGLKVEEGFFDEDMARTLGSYDFIHLSEVLEHITQPFELLKTAKTLLAPGGVLCLSVPNDFNPLQAAVQKVYEKEAWWVVPDHHLNYFTFESLENLLTKAGLKPVKKLTNFPMELFLLMGQDYTSVAGLGRKMHAWRKNMDISMGNADSKMHQAFYESLAESNIGRLAIIFAVVDDEGAE